MPPAAASVLAVLLALGSVGWADGLQEAERLRVRLTVTTALRYRNTPIDPVIDFPQLIRRAGLPGVVDPNSIEVVLPATGETIPHAVAEAFAYGDKGRIAFVARDPEHREFELRFRVVDRCPPRRPPRVTPLIGSGDLLRYNSGRPGPVTLIQSMGLHDVTGDGKLDLVGTWNYYYRPGSPTGGVVFYPAVGGGEPDRFGDLQRLRYRSADGVLRHFSHHYNSAAFADFNHDGRVDFVYARSGASTADFYLATGDRQPGGGPVYEHGGSVAVRGANPCRAVDLDQDGALDLVVGGDYLRNGGAGWPFEASPAVRLDAGEGACFHDLDGDGRVDSICLVEPPASPGLSGPAAGRRVAWRRGAGGHPPEFAAARHVRGIDAEDVTMVAAARAAGRTLLLVQTRFQQIHVYVQTGTEPPAFRRRGRAESISAVLSLSDQAWPCLCDWDDDGDLDLLIGDGYGWPRIVINEGSRARPVFAEPRHVMAEGKPIRLLRNEILGPPGNWHNMGYPYPDFVDWDGDGLRDLMLPNETNRIFWYRNVGSKRQPRFGIRRQILCDGYPDSPELRARSQQRANDPDSNNGVYPLEDDRPFFWRTGVAFADWNGDGLIDLATMDGSRRQATLFTQYRGSDGELRLKRDRTLMLADGRPLDDRVVQRSRHWGESLRAVDWDRDGRIDLLYTVAGSHHGTLDGGSIYLLRNVGSKQQPLFAAPETMRCFGEPIRITNHGPHPWPGDLDGDGAPDLLACVEWSVYPFYSHAALMMNERPEYRLSPVEAAR